MQACLSMPNTNIIFTESAYCSYGEALVSSNYRVTLLNITYAFPLPSFYDLFSMFELESHVILTKGQVVFPQNSSFCPPLFNSSLDRLAIFLKML